MIYQVTSKDNRRVVEAGKLKQAKFQKETGLFLAEGFHLLEMAVAAGSVLYVFAKKPIAGLNVDQYIVNDDILRKLASSKTPQGVVSVCKAAPSQPIATDKVICLDDIADPGNLGTILRTALAFGYRDVALSLKCVSPYNDKALNASQGALFKLNLVEMTSKEIISLGERGYKLVATSLEGSASLSSFKLQPPYVIILGNEAHGVSNELLKAADYRVKIDISGIDSLNVAVASGIVLYELNRK